MAVLHIMQRRLSAATHVAPHTEDWASRKDMDSA